MGAQMDTFAARLASFDATVPSIKSRASTTSRTIQPIAWPYDSPSPEQLADAGFFFNPYDTNPDNTTCFLCRRALDGWEDGDNPVEEHLKHSPDCGWAIMMFIQQNTSKPSEIEDPTLPSVAEARKATFSVGWPHDGKRGWLCQSDKMVEAGWYFCPSDDSPDLASCPYCKLSLDGWEETDDPFEEHHRRSSTCSFFVFALPAAKSTKKGTRAKKPRVSKASRLSTQSVMTTTSEAPVEDDQMDVSVMSQATAKKGKAGKRSTKPKSKKSKKTDTVDVTADEADIAEEQFAEAEPVEDKSPEPAKPKRATRGKKRASEAISQDTTAESQHEEPSPKRRATAIRNSAVSQSVAAEQDDVEEAPIEEPSPKPPAKKGRKGAKKAGSTKTRKASTASATTKMAAHIARDESVLDAAIEEDHDRTLQNSEPFEFQYKDEKRESARFGKQSISASTASAQNPGSSVLGEETVDEQEQQPEQLPEDELDPALDTESIVEAPVEPKTKKESKRKPTTKKPKKGKASVQPEPELEDEPEPMQLERDHTPEEEYPEEHPYTASEKDELESSPAQKSSVFAEIPVEEPRPASKQGKKQGRKQATDKAKRPTKTTETEKEPVSRASSVDASDELANLSLNHTESKSTTRKNARKRKSQEEEEIEIADEHEIPVENKPQEDKAHPAQTKLKRGHLSKDAEDRGSETEQHSKPKAKRGRPAKQSQKQLPEPQQQRKQTIENAEEQEDGPEQNAYEDQTLTQSSTAIEDHAQDVVPKTEDQPKRGRPAKSKAPSKAAKEQEDELQRNMDEDNKPEVVSQAKEQPKRGRPSKLKAPPKTAQRYSDLPQDTHRAQSFIESVAQSSPPQSSKGVIPGSGTQERTPSLSPQSSDAENQPPSARPPSARPPIFSPAKTQTTRVPLATSTPTLSPSKRQLKTGNLSSTHSWKPSDIEQLLLDSLADKENRGFTGSLNISKQMLTSPEMKMTVDEWIKFNAKDGEEKLKLECERLIGVFEKEGGRAMRALEGLECVE